jgi:hypothetical protein
VRAESPAGPCNSCRAPGGGSTVVEYGTRRRHAVPSIPFRWGDPQLERSVDQQHLRCLIRLGRQDDSALIKDTRQISQSRVDVHFSHRVFRLPADAMRIWALSPGKLRKTDMESLGALKL